MKNKIVVLLLLLGLSFYGFNMVSKAYNLIQILEIENGYVTSGSYTTLETIAGSGIYNIVYVLDSTGEELNVNYDDINNTFSFYVLSVDTTVILYNTNTTNIEGLLPEVNGYFARVQLTLDDIEEAEWTHYTTYNKNEFIYGFRMTMLVDNLTGVINFNLPVYEAFAHIIHNEAQTLTYSTFVVFYDDEDNVITSWRTSLNKDEYWNLFGYYDLADGGWYSINLRDHQLYGVLARVELNVVVKFNSAPIIENEITYLNANTSYSQSVGSSNYFTYIVLGKVWTSQDVYEIPEIAESPVLPDHPHEDKYYSFVEWETVDGESLIDNSWFTYNDLELAGYELGNEIYLYARVVEKYIATGEIVTYANLWGIDSNTFSSPKIKFRIEYNEIPYRLLNIYKIANQYLRFDYASEYSEIWIRDHDNKVILSINLFNYLTEVLYLDIDDRWIFNDNRKIEIDIEKILLTYGDGEISIHDIRFIEMYLVTDPLGDLNDIVSQLNAYSNLNTTTYSGGQLKEIIYIDRNYIEGYYVYNIIPPYITPTQTAPIYEGEQMGFEGWYFIDNVKYTFEIPPEESRLENYQIKLYAKWEKRGIVIDNDDLIPQDPVVDTTSRIALVFAELGLNTLTGYIITYLIAVIGTTILIAKMGLSLIAGAGAIVIITAVFNIFGFLPILLSIVVYVGVAAVFLLRGGV